MAMPRVMPITNEATKPMSMRFMLKATALKMLPSPTPLTSLSKTLNGDGSEYGGQTPSRTMPSQSSTRTSKKAIGTTILDHRSGRPQAAFGGAVVVGLADTAIGGRLLHLNVGLQQYHGGGD